MRLQNKYLYLHTRRRTLVLRGLFAVVVGMCTTTTYSHERRRAARKRQIIGPGDAMRARIVIHMRDAFFCCLELISSYDYKHMYIYIFNMCACCYTSVKTIVIYIRRATPSDASGLYAARRYHRVNSTRPPPSLNRRHAICERGWWRLHARVCVIGPPVLTLCIWNTHAPIQFKQVPSQRMCEARKRARVDDAIARL